MARELELKRMTKPKLIELLLSMEQSGVVAEKTEVVVKEVIKEVPLECDCEYKYQEEMDSLKKDNSMLKDKLEKVQKELEGLKPLGKENDKLVNKMKKMEKDMKKVKSSKLVEELPEQMDEQVQQRIEYFQKRYKDTRNEMYLKKIEKLKK